MFHLKLPTDRIDFDNEIAPNLGMFYLLSLPLPHITSSKIAPILGMFHLPIEKAPFLGMFEFQMKMLLI